MPSSIGCAADLRATDPAKRRIAPRCAVTDMRGHRRKLSRPVPCRARCAELAVLSVPADDQAERISGTERTAVPVRRVARRVTTQRDVGAGLRVAWS
jgi:hypothetical protein